MLSRRRFAVTSSLALAGLVSPGSVRAAAAMRPLSGSQRRWLLAVLPGTDQHYDPFAKMLVVSAPEGSNHHTQLKSGRVRATRPSLTYAAALLDADERWRTERAIEILRVVVSMQDQDSAGQTYGHWPWYLEEPLATMSPPDPSSTQACAMPLLMVWIGHRGRLGKALENAVGESILHAARAIERRSLDPNETHGAILAVGVMLVAAQEFKLTDLRAQAKDKLRKLYDHIVRQDSLAEYNSPIDTVAALQELSRMLWLVKDARDRSLITAVHDLAWKHAATRFHAPTRQWAGPHSRNDQTNLLDRPATLAFLQAASGGRADFQLGEFPPLSLDAFRIPLQCPRQWTRHFTRLDGSRQIVETFAKADPAKPGAHNPVVGTTWLHPRFALGSVNRGDFWLERRPLVAYWGAAGAPRYLRARFLKDGRDFASALFFSVQHEGAVLAAVTFATDRGDNHPTLDPIRDGTIRARDLRLRFEFGGATDALTVKTAGAEQKYLVVQDRGIRWLIRPLDGTFGPGSFVWDFLELKLTNQIDAVAYRGDEQSFKLTELGEAFACFALEEWPFGEPEPASGTLKLIHSNHTAGASLVSRGKLLQLLVETKPQPFAAHCDTFTSRVSNPPRTALPQAPAR